MRYAALLLMLLGCSAGPSVVVSDPPVVVVEPVVAEKPAEPVSDAYKLPDADKQNAPVPDSVVAEKPSNVPETPDSCECGDDCRCVDCQCADCPHRAVKDSLTVRFKLLSHPTCIHCQKAKESAKESGVEVEIVESDEAWELAREAGAMRDFQDGNGLQPALPAWVVYVDGRPVKSWVGPSNAAGVRQMRRIADEAAGLGSSGVHEAKPQDAAKPGEPPAWCVRVHIDGNGGIGTGSGVVVSPGLVLTNRHVAQVPGRVRVLVNGQWRVGSRRAYAPAGDLALIAVDCRDVSPVPVASAVSDGDAVATHGYAAGVVYRTQATTFRTDGTVNGDAIEARSCSGESGGPVVNSRGELVGLIYGAEVEGTPDGGRGLVVDLPSIRAFLSRQGVL